MTDTTQTINREARVSKKIFFMALAVVAIVALAAIPAFAEGYNTPTQYTRGAGYFSGPHGGYATTTNKCADCHSTHYAKGSFMLMRANSREAACDYCHGGGGGSTVNIMMDNAYKTVAGTDMYMNGVAEATTTTGFGTGHTLGYKGNAPADINPAFTSAAGLACFDCHSPHGNSDRVMTSFANPGRAIGATNVVIRPGQPGFMGNVSADGIVDNVGRPDTTIGEWGIDPQFGNFKWFGDPYAAGGRPSDDSSGARLIYRPIFPTGRWLLLEDPHSTSAEGAADTVVATAGVTADNGVNKYAVNWSDPLGPADGTYGGFQDNNNNRSDPWNPTGGGFLTSSEFCVDCHDGTGGASTQAANVWNPAGVSGSTAGAYAVTYAHDTQPRH